MRWSGRGVHIGASDCLSGGGSHKRESARRERCMRNRIPSDVGEWGGTDFPSTSFYFGPSLFKHGEHQPGERRPPLQLPAGDCVRIGLWSSNHRHRGSTCRGLSRRFAVHHVRFPRSPKISTTDCFSLDLTAMYLYMRRFNLANIVQCTYFLCLEDNERFLLGGGQGLF